MKNGTGYPKVVAQHSEDTGGGCMVDFLVFDNNTYVTLDDVSSSLHHNPSGITTFKHIYSLWVENGENALYTAEHYDATPIFDDICPAYKAVNGCHWVSDIQGSVITIEDLAMVAVYPTMIDVIKILDMETRLPHFYPEKLTGEYVDSWIEELDTVNLTYHFDDNPRDVIYVEQGVSDYAPVFTKLECMQLDRIMSYVYTLREEGYDPFVKLVSLTK